MGRGRDAIPAGSTAARGSRPRSTGRPATSAELNATERAFLDASRRASGRAQRRLRLVLAGVVGLLVLAVIAGVVALDQRGTRARRGDRGRGAAPRRAGARRGDLDRSLLLARQGVALDNTLQTRGNLLAALLKSPAAIGVLRGDGGPLTGVDISPDDRALASVAIDGTLNLVDTRTRRPLIRSMLLPGHISWGPDDVRFSPDGARLAVGGTEPVVLKVGRNGRVTKTGWIPSTRSSTVLASRRTGGRCTRLSTTTRAGCSSSASTRAAAPGSARRNSPRRIPRA